MDNVVINITEITDSVQINVNEAITQVFTDGVTVTGNGTISNPLVAVAGSGDMLRSTYDPTNVNADAFSMENMIEGVTKKILTSTERTKLNNLSGTNTGDQDLTPYLTSATAAATYQPIGSYLTSISGLNISQLTNDSGYITSAALSPYLTATVAAATYQPIGSYLTSISGLNISQLTNDSGFITSAALSGLVPTSRTITINGTTYDLSADRSWTISAGTTYTFSTGLTNNAGTVTANLATGVAGGQSVIGGTAASNNLTLSSTSNATKGKILFGNSAYDEANNRLGLGTSSPSALLHITASAEVMRVQGDSAFITFYNNTNTTRTSYIQADNSNKWFNIAVENSLKFRTFIGSLEAHIIDLSGRHGIGGVTSPTAFMDIKAGTTAIAPLRLNAGTNLTTPVNGAFEYDGTNLYFTTGGVRKTVTLV